jgi:hypothetical protein
MRGARRAKREDWARLEAPVNNLLASIVVSDRRMRPAEFRPGCAGRERGLGAKVVRRDDRRN